MNTKYTIILIGLFVLPLVGYCQEKTVDTVIQKKHYLELRYNDSLNNVSYEINWPGCMWGSWGLYRGQSKIAPLISVCLPYNDYLEYEWTGSGEDDIIVHSYRFPNDQFFIIYLDNRIRKFCKRHDSLIVGCLRISCGNDAKTSI